MIANDFNIEAKRITKKCISAAVVKKIIRNTIEYFSTKKYDFIIPAWLFDDRKLIILLRPFLESN